MKMARAFFVQASKPPLRLSPDRSASLCTGCEQAVPWLSFVLWFSLASALCSLPWQEHSSFYRSKRCFAALFVSARSSLVLTNSGSLRLPSSMSCKEPCSKRECCDRSFARVHRHRKRHHHWVWSNIQPTLPLQCTEK